MFYICEIVYQGKRFQESTGATSKTVAREYEKRRKAEMERAAASHRPKSVLFANGRLAKVKKALGNVVLSDLTDERIRDYIRQRKAEKISGRTINMEVGELSRQSASLGLCYGPRFAGSKSVKTWVVRFPMTNRSAVAGIRLRQQTEESTGNFEVVPVKVPVPEQLLPIQ